MPEQVSHLPLSPETTSVEAPPLTSSAPRTAELSRGGAVSRASSPAPAHAAVGAWYGLLAGFPTGLVLGAVSGVLYLLIPLVFQAARGMLFGIPGSNWTDVADVFRGLFLVAFIGALYGVIPGTLIGSAIGALAAVARDERTGAIAGAVLGAVLGPLFLWGDTLTMFLAVFAGAVGGFLVARMTAARSGL
jgi:hypothetical protein